MKKRGITRVDLVVVVVVAAVCAALAVPVLSAGTVKDDLTLCLRRSLNLSDAILQYTADHNGILPPGKYGHQAGHPVPKVWTELLYEQGYVETKEQFQCPADNVTDNENLYYDYGPAYPDWWASYALPMNLCDLFWQDHTPQAAVLANHEGYFDRQILLGESECNCIIGSWFGSGPGSDPWSFRGSYMRQFPFDRHKGYCTYVMLDGRAKVMRVPASDAVNDTQFETEIRAQFEECDGEHFMSVHVCFWNKYRRGLTASNPYAF
jgi:hypothetical protein